MKKTIERKTVVTFGEKITNVKIINEGTAVEITSILEVLENQEETTISDCEQPKATQEYIEEYFPIVKASTLSLDDEFLKYKPKTEQQKTFKKSLVKAIKSGLIDFRAQRMDPSFDKNGRIYYQAGEKPAVGKSTNWWKENAKEFLPEKNSREGSTKERIAFLGLLIKYLIEKEGYTVSDAWKAVCDQSKDLGHYWDSKDAKYDFEPTGSRKIGEWFDLANAYKITVDDEASGFSLFGGFYSSFGDDYPLADVDNFNNSNGNHNDSTGWLVLSV